MNLTLTIPESTQPPITVEVGGTTELTSYVAQVAGLPDYPATFPPAIGSAANQAVAGNDPRLTNPRTPSPHTHPLAELTGVTPAAIGAMANTNAAVNAAIEDGPAATREAIGIFSPPETVPDDVIFRDDCFGPAQSMAQLATRLVSPGPGTLTASQVSTGGTCSYENGELVLANPGTANSWIVVHAGEIAAAAGLTVIATLVPAFEKGSSARETYLGFVPWVARPSTMSAQRGAIQISAANDGTSVSIGIPKGNNNTDTAFVSIGTGLFEAGEEIRLCVHYKSLTHQEYFIQGGQATSFGAIIGTEDWLKIGETFMDLTGLSVAPAIGNQFNGVIRVREFQVLRSWKPSTRHAQFDYNRVDLGTHNPSILRDPVSGLIVGAWNRGEQHGSTDITIRAVVRKPDRTWTDIQVLVPAINSGTAFNHISALCDFGGELYLTWRYAANNSTLERTNYRAKLTVNPSTGEITVGTPQVIYLGIAAANDAHRPTNPSVTTTTGRIIWGGHGAASGASWHYSDDDGATWTSGYWGHFVANLVELALVEESDGAVGCIFRSMNSGNKFAYYSRCVDPTATVLVWTEPTTVKAIPMPTSGTAGSRLWFKKLTTGEILLIGNDSNTDRSNLTIWRMGDNAQVLGKVRVGDWGNKESGAQSQYPVMEQDGDDIITLYSRQPSTVAAGGISIPMDTRKWVQPVSTQAGGTGVVDVKPTITPRKYEGAVRIGYSTTPTPNLSFGNRFWIRLEASTAVIQKPLNPLPWQEMEIICYQHTGGNHTISGWDAVYEFNGATTTLQTAFNASNVFRFVYNPVSLKWVLASFI